MPKSRKASLEDGYSVLKAVQHAAKAHPEARPLTAAPDQPSELQKLGAHVRRTVVPAKQIIECYECGYKFQLHGRAPATNCSKCRTVLDLTDHTIDGKWNKPFKTAGTIRLTAKGVLESGELVANDFILEGTIEAGTVRAMRKLVLHPGTRFSEVNVTAPNLAIAPGATIAFIDPSEYHDVEIAGTLRANLHATGLVTIKNTGLLQGQVRAARLVVEDGGGLTASVHIENSGSAP